MSFDTSEEYRRQGHEFTIGAAPFDVHDRVTYLATGQNGTVESVEYQAGYADRLDEPGESPWWEVIVLWDDGIRDEFDADELQPLDEDADA
jgi:hypothetical protein